MSRFRPFRPALLLLSGLCLSVLVPGCSSAPGAESLPPDEGVIRTVDLNPEAAGVPDYVALDVKGVKGGQLRYTLPGRVNDVAAMLLDFDKADGHRAWARRYEMLESGNRRVRARWVFRGKMGIQPTVEIDFRAVPEKNGVIVRYRLSKKSFGVAAFFGDHRVVGLHTTPPSVEVTSRVFIDSGLKLFNASRADIEKGLRRDAELMRAWMISRLSPAE